MLNLFFCSPMSRMASFILMPTENWFDLCSHASASWWQLGFYGLRQLHLPTRSRCYRLGSSLDQDLGFATDSNSLFFLCALGVEYPPWPFMRHCTLLVDV